MTPVAPLGMVPVPGGSFTMGSDRHYPEERPAHPVHVDGFWMDATTVTNADDARSVPSTVYQTYSDQGADKLLRKVSFSGHFLAVKLSF